MADKKIAAGEEADINLVAARAGQIERVCSSSLAAESYSMVGAMAACEWVHFAYLEMRNANFTSAALRRKLREWEASAPGREPVAAGGVLAL